MQKKKTKTHSKRLMEFTNKHNIHLICSPRRIWETWLYGMNIWNVENFLKSMRLSHRSKKHCEL